MNYFFTSDHHFHHTNIISLCNRPFQNVEEMNKELIKRWNEKITTSDIVYHLGDFSWLSHIKAISDLLSALNFKEFHLLIGNHEKLSFNSKIASLFTTYATHRDIKINHQWITICHYPMKHWYKENADSWNLHGHSHGRDSNPFLNQLDVSVDNTNFYPLSFDEVKKQIEIKNRRISLK